MYFLRFITICLTGEGYDRIKIENICEKAKQPIDLSTYQPINQSANRPINKY